MIFPYKHIINAKINELTSKESALILILSSTRRDFDNVRDDIEKACEDCITDNLDCMKVVAPDYFNWGDIVTIPIQYQVKHGFCVEEAFTDVNVVSHDEILYEKE